MMNHLDSLRDELWSRPSGGNGAKYVEEAQKGRHSFLHVFWNIKLDTMWNWLICFGGVCVCKQRNGLQLYSTISLDSQIVQQIGSRNLWIELD
jgi:hypothetical protein